MDIWRTIADRKIREAMDEGAFEQLEGAGKPLTEEDLSYSDPSLWMAHHIMKNNGVAPPWVAEGNEIEAEAQRLRTLLATTCGAQRGRVVEQIAELNRRIANFNLAAPAAVHKVPLDSGSR